MLIKCNLDHLRRSVIDEDRTLLIIRELQQFLTEIVAKGIWNKLISWFERGNETVRYLS